MARWLLFLAVGLVPGCHADPCSASSCFELVKTTRVGAGSEVEWSIEGKPHRLPIVAEAPETVAACALVGAVGVASSNAADLLPATKMTLRCPESWRIGVDLDLGDLRDRGAGTTTAFGRDLRLGLTVEASDSKTGCRLDVAAEKVTLVTEAVGGRQAAPAMVTPDYRRVVIATLHVVGKSTAMVPSGVCPDVEATVTLRLEETAADWKATPRTCLCE